MYFSASLHHHQGNTTRNRNNTINANARQPPRTGSPQLYGCPWLAFFSHTVGLYWCGPTLCPVCACGPPQVMTSSTAQLPVGSRLLMKPGHSIPKIQGLCNWSGSTVCLCVSVSLYVVEMVWLCNRVDIITAYKIQKSFEPRYAFEGQFNTNAAARTHLKDSGRSWIIDTEAMCQSPWSGLETESRLNVHQPWPQPDRVTHSHRHTRSHAHGLQWWQHSPTDQSDER